MDGDLIAAPRRRRDQCTGTITDVATQGATMRTRCRWTPDGQLAVVRRTVGRFSFRTEGLGAVTCGTSTNVRFRRAVVRMLSPKGL